MLTGELGCEWRRPQGIPLDLGNLVPRRQEKYSLCCRGNSSFVSDKLSVNVLQDHPASQVRQALALQGQGPAESRGATDQALRGMCLVKQKSEERLFSFCGRRWKEEAVQELGGESGERQGLDKSRSARHSPERRFLQSRGEKMSLAGGPVITGPLLPRSHSWGKKDEERDTNAKS